MFARHDILRQQHSLYRSKRFEYAPYISLRQILTIRVEVKIKCIIKKEQACRTLKSPENKKLLAAHDLISIYRAPGTQYGICYTISTGTLAPGTLVPGVLKRRRCGAALRLPLLSALSVAMLLEYCLVEHTEQQIVIFLLITQYFSNTVIA